jgi:hypothetical protein
MPFGVAQRTSILDGKDESYPRPPPSCLLRCPARSRVPGLPRRELIYRLRKRWCEVVAATSLAAAGQASSGHTGRAVRRVTHGELASPAMPAGVLASVPAIPFHQRHTAGALPSLLPAAWELPGSFWASAPRLRAASRAGARHGSRVRARISPAPAFRAVTGTSRATSSWAGGASGARVRMRTRPKMRSGSPPRLSILAGCLCQGAAA